MPVRVIGFRIGRIGATVAVPPARVPTVTAMRQRDLKGKTVDLPNRTSDRASSTSLRPHPWHEEESVAARSYEADHSTKSCPAMPQLFGAELL